VLKKTKTVHLDICQLFMMLPVTSSDSWWWS